MPTQNADPFGLNVTCSGTPTPGPVWLERALRYPNLDLFDLNNEDAMQDLGNWEFFSPTSKYAGWKEAPGIGIPSE